MDVSELDALPFDDTSQEIALTPQQEFFVQEFLIDVDAAKAALRAGFNPGYGTHLLKTPYIANRLRVAMAQRLARIGATQDTVLHELSMLALSDITHYVIDDEGHVELAPGAPSGAMKAVQSVKRKVRIHYNKEGEIVGKDYDLELRLWDKPGSLKLLGKHAGLNFSDRMEVSGANGG